MDYPVSDPTVGLVGGKFSDGDPVNGIPASRWPSETADAIMDELIAVIDAAGIVPDEATLDQVKTAIATLIAAAAPQSNFAAAVDPAVGNDSSEGYAVGSKWYNTATGGWWLCTDATAGAAVWQPLARRDADNAFSADQTINGNLYVTGVVQAGVT